MIFGCGTRSYRARMSFAFLEYLEHEPCEHNRSSRTRRDPRGWYSTSNMSFNQVTQFEFFPPRRSSQLGAHLKARHQHTHLAEHDQRRHLVEGLDARGPIRRRVSVSIHGQVDGPRRVRHVVRERVVLLHGVVEQAVDLAHAGPHERGNARGRDAAQALQRGGQPEQVVRGGEEEEEEKQERGEREEEADSSTSSSSSALAQRRGHRCRRC